MQVVPPQAAELTLPAPNNPTDRQRHEMLYNSLTKEERVEDYDNIINLLSPPPDITRYAPSEEFKNIKVGIIGVGLQVWQQPLNLGNLDMILLFLNLILNVLEAEYTHTILIGTKECMVNLEQ